MLHPTKNDFATIALKERAKSSFLTHAEYKMHIEDIAQEAGTRNMRGNIRIQHNMILTPKDISIMQQQVADSILLK